MDGYSINYYEFLSPGSSPYFALLLMVLLGAIFVKRPMLAMAFICVQPYFLWAVNTSYEFSFYLAYLAVAIIIVRYKKRIFSRRRPSYGPILVLAMILVFWSVISPVIYPIRDGMFCGYSLSRVNFVGSLLPMLLLPSILRTKKHFIDFVRSFIGLLAVLNGVMFICCLVLLATGRSFVLLPSTNILGVMPHSSEAALLLISLTFVYVIGWMDYRRIIPLVLIGLFCLFIGDSRTKLLASLLCSAYIILPYLRRFVIPAVVISSLLFIGLIILPENIKTQGVHLIENRIKQTTSEDIDVATSGRSILYRQAYQSFLSAPWIGVGEGYATRPLISYGKLMRPAPHSYYIGVLAQQGIIGVGILAAVLVLTFRLILRLQSDCKLSSRDTIMVRFIIAIVVYGLLCMVLKASWGSTFWSLALLQVYHNVNVKKRLRSRIQWPVTRRGLGDIDFEQNKLKNPSPVHT